MARMPIAALALLSSSALAVEPSPTIAILAFGQSNMEGAYGPPPGGDPYSLQVRAWNVLTDNWGNAALGAAPFLSPSQGSTPPSTPNNLAYVFAKELARHCEKNVHLVLVASGGKKIEYFLPNSTLSANGWVNSQSSTLYGSSAAEELMGVAPYGDAIPALATLAGKTRFDAVIMHQGEANVGTNGDTAAIYRAKLEALYSELDRRGVIDLGATPILLGHINSAYANATNHASAIDGFALAHSKVGIVNWSGIETVGSGNNHATGKGLEQLGVRYFNKYMEVDGSAACQ